MSLDLQLHTHLRQPAGCTSAETKSQREKPTPLKARNGDVDEDR